MSTKVIGVQQLNAEIDEADIPEDGIVSSAFILFADLTKDDLDCIFETDPDWVLEKRPDYIKQYHPEKLH